MSTASPTAYLLWAILSVLFLGFLIYHLWSYDKFKCLHWSAGRQPGAFKRVMTYSYLASVPLFVIYSVAMTVIKFKEGWLVLLNREEDSFIVVPKPLDMYDPANRHWIVPLAFVFSFAWGLELITHLEELAFWLYLLHQTPGKAEWFDSWEYRMWYMGSMTAFIGMPLTTLIARRNVITLDAYIFLVGSSGSTGTTLLFLYVLWNFPKFLKHVKAEGADPTVVVRLTTFYHLNLARVVFRFLFTVPLFIVAVDGLVGTVHRINRSLFWTDFLLMIAGIGCFVSTTITLLIFFPRSFTKEAGYKPKPPTSIGAESPKSSPVTPPSIVNRSRGFSTEWNGHPSPNIRSFVGSPTESRWGSQFYPDSHFREADDDDLAYGSQYDGEEEHAPPYATGLVEANSSVQFGAHTYSEQAAYQRQPFPHSLSSPFIPSSALSPPPTPSPVPGAVAHTGGPTPTAPSLPQVPSRTPVKRHAKRRSSVNQPSTPADVQRYSQGHARGVSGGNGLGFALPEGEESTPSIVKPPVGGQDMQMQVAQLPATGSRPRRDPHRRQSSNLHPYVMTFTSPIDLADLHPPSQDLPRTTI